MVRQTDKTVYNNNCLFYQFYCLFIVCLHLYSFREEETILLYQDKCLVLTVLLRLAHLLGGSL